MYVHSHLSNDWMMAVPPQVGDPCCFSPGEMSALRAGVAQLPGNGCVPCGLHIVPRADFLWFIECRVQVAAVDFDITEHSRARAASPCSDARLDWKWLLMTLTGRALISKTSRAPCTPGCFNRAVTVSPQAGHQAGTPSKKHFVQCSA